MRGQWSLILGIIAAVIIAIFAVINVDSVRVNYMFGTAEWPLILVILGSVLMGAIIVGAVGMVRIYQLQAEIKRLKHNQESSNSDAELVKKGKRNPSDQSGNQNRQKEIYQSKEKSD
ncbi:LapA family protein [Halalkalibacter alkaliphilus]|uniref:Lipopolysaccharide assembly protein LapA domain-containing protein n=1 Tax=Halalkalibacter alkaliphilus TaxID=2917993 RepID=A0A9X1ZYA3_9BACI|nr:lipopolysaccharide assembly protein LapA domain-containing protein [Halalkalibacter alkaliphilus]MCL7746943.1 lipopolysaccharide assembly protein LapA domain-containing protein [Halalkalibacter alkaliphilus]